jgi:BirA family biotin operon repressor/biotin-[acetyl-CoA-carboxylase] ligase
MPEKRLSEFARLQSVLAGSLFSSQIVFEEVLESTNTVAKDLARKGAENGTLVITEEQTAGRGRMNRKWLSPKGVNLIFSLLLRPQSLTADRIFVPTMLFALAVVKTLKRKTAMEPWIKWPNDIYVSGKKLGGILTEFSVRGKAVEYVVLGLGLNVNWHPGEKETVLYPSTSVLSETGKRISRVELLGGILLSFDRHYKLLEDGEIDALYREWNELSLIQGKRVCIRTEGATLYGRAVRIDRCGALIFENDRGEKQTVFCGDVSLTIEQEAGRGP